MNISSVVVYAQSQQLTAVQTALAALPGVQVHAQTADGKLVVCIEANDDRDAAATYETIERSAGVLSMALVFQQTESNPDQEITPCKSPVVN
ncbi:MAG: hypothetical protein AUJ20_06235 [Comamonadaceae bacterium CG1_02_60_18]|nr:MAG: hypothetical protein AUJ20_06235 [Comamonadaceae bacterium CG1_02_60_18]